MGNEILATLLPVAGWEPQRAKEVDFSGGKDPILPTPFRIGEAAAASLGAVGLAVSDLWELRTGRRQQIAVDTRRATASLRSSRYLKLNDAPAAGERPSVMGVYPAKNGRWSYLHCNFPNHREAALSVLGVEERPGSRAPGSVPMGCPGAGGGDYRGQGGRRDGSLHGRMGAASAVGRRGVAAADGD